MPVLVEYRIQERKKNSVDREKIGKMSRKKNKLK